MIELLALHRRQPILAAALVTVGLRNPIADRLGRRFEIPRQFLRAAAGSNQAREITSSVTGQVSSVASDMADKGANLASSTTQQEKTFATELENMARRNPLGAIAGAVMVGVLMGMIGRRKRMILLRFLKLFGVDVPGHIAQLQARFEQRVEVAKDEVRQTAQKAAIVAALAAVGGLAALSAAGVGLLALYRWVLENYGAFYGFETVDGVLIVIAVILFVTAFLEARSRWADSAGHDGHEPRRAATEAADHTSASNATALDEPPLITQPSPRAAHGATSPADLVGPLSVILSRVMKLPTAGNPVLDELLFALRGSVKGAADEAVDGVVHAVRYGDRAKLVAALGTAVLVGWLLARHRADHIRSD
jgi:hypothetical protein